MRDHSPSRTRETQVRPRINVDTWSAHTVRTFSRTQSHEHTNNITVMSTGNVIGGYKATLSNANASDEAKENAQQKIEELQPQYEEEQQTREETGKNPGNVAGGLKATLKNPNVSEEAKEHARERLENQDF
ncbi:hypothetical protein PROFUN_05306 [Planoprotostelium fungivorum]|uniref:Conidiation-specific protein 6 n=1 Tax=Planoprotostelium fungivorum TaxID=1890364 RepID=A0A2P6NRE0_9EUKA|nr:hypothetical protein PROFUN_05306 [Planoprotostelium fungivorum]